MAFLLIGAACGGADVAETLQPTSPVVSTTDTGSSSTTSVVPPETTTTEATAPTELALAEASSVFDPSRSQLLFDGELFRIPLVRGIAGGGRLASLVSPDGETWEVVYPDDSGFQYGPVDWSYTQVGEWTALVPIGRGSDVAFVSRDLRQWTEVPHVVPDALGDEGLEWRPFGFASPETGAFLLGQRPNVSAELIGFKGVVIGCSPPCQDRYASTESDEVRIFNTDLDASVDRIFDVDADGELIEVPAPPFSVRWLMRSPDNELFAVDRFTVRAPQAALFVDGEWQQREFVEADGNPFGVRAHLGSVYWLNLQLGDIFELFVSRDLGLTWESAWEFEPGQLPTSIPFAGFAGGPAEEVAIAVGGSEGGLLLYAANGRDFQLLSELDASAFARRGPAFLAIGNGLLGFWTGSDLEFLPLDSI